MLADGHVLTKTLACGIAYPVRTKDGMMANNPNMNNPRADGFSLYMNFVGDTILKTLLPKSKMIKNSIHKIMLKTQSIADAPPPMATTATSLTYLKSSTCKSLRRESSNTARKMRDLSQMRQVCS